MFFGGLPYALQERGINVLCIAIEIFQILKSGFQQWRKYLPPLLKQDQLYVSRFTSRLT